MIERMTALLPADRQQLSRNIVPRRDNFEVLYHLHFDNLCADFQVCDRLKLFPKNRYSGVSLTGKLNSG